MEALMSFAMPFFIGVVFAVLAVAIFKSNPLRLIAAFASIGSMVLLLNLFLGHMLSLGSWTGYVFVAAGVMTTLFVADCIKKKEGGQRK